MVSTFNSAKKMFTVNFHVTPTSKTLFIPYFGTDTKTQLNTIKYDFKVCDGTR